MALRLVHLISGSRLFLPNISREQCDLNRPGCRRHPYRQLVSSSVGKSDIVVDIHSFSGGKGRVGSAAGNVPLILLTHRQSPQLCQQLAYFLSQQLSVPISIGYSELGDIRQEFADKRIPNVTIEFNANYPTASLDPFVLTIARFFNFSCPSKSLN
jgi:hypothetical protein